MGHSAPHSVPDRPTPARPACRLGPPLPSARLHPGPGFGPAGSGTAPPGRLARLRPPPHARLRKRTHRVQGCSHAGLPGQARHASRTTRPAQTGLPHAACRHRRIWRQAQGFPSGVQGRQDGRLLRQVSPPGCTPVPRAARPSGRNPTRAPADRPLAGTDRPGPADRADTRGLGARRAACLPCTGGCRQMRTAAGRQTAQGCARHAATVRAGEAGRMRPAGQARGRAGRRADAGAFAPDPGGAPPAGRS
jgi:hypothetical protein